MSGNDLIDMCCENVAGLPEEAFDETGMAALWMSVHVLI